MDEQGLRLDVPGSSPPPSGWRRSATSSPLASTDDHALQGSSGFPTWLRRLQAEEEDKSEKAEYAAWRRKHARFMGHPIEQLGRSQEVVSLRGVSIDVLEQVVFWEAEQFGVRTAKDRAQLYRAAFGATAAGRTDSSPWGYLECLVVLDTKCQEPLGAASLVRNDLVWCKRNPGLSPWLSSLFVKGKMRGRGLGARLVQEVARTARSMGFSELYVAVCPDKKDLNKWYERQGFEGFFGQKLWAGFRIMRKDLRCPATHEKHLGHPSQR